MFVQNAYLTRCARYGEGNNHYYGKRKKRTDGIKKREKERGWDILLSGRTMADPPDALVKTQDALSGRW